MENRRVLKKEGLNLTIDKEVLDDQRVLEVSTEVPDKAKVEKENKDDFENYKVLYKGAIDDRCLEEYGTCDDEKLWEDIAKEMFLKAVNYIPEEDKKADGELVDREKEQEPILVRENRSVIKHTKVVESKKLNEDIENFDDPDEVAEALGHIAKLTEEIEKWWEGINPQDRDRLDDEFTGTISDHIRWLGSNVNEILDNELKDFKTLSENKECPKQD